MRTLIRAVIMKGYHFDSFVSLCCGVHRALCVCERVVKKRPLPKNLRSSSASIRST